MVLRKDLPITLAVSAPEYLKEEARAAIERAVARVLEAARRESDALLAQFPPDDPSQHPSQKKGCCGE